MDLAFAETKVAHKRVQPDLSEDFGYIIVGMYYSITAAMVFGSQVSATSWEPFRRVIEVTTKVFFFRSDLAKKY